VEGGEVIFQGLDRNLGFSIKEIQPVDRRRLWLQLIDIQGHSMEADEAG